MSRPVLAAVDVTTDILPAVEVAAAEAAVRHLPLHLVCAGAQPTPHSRHPRGSPIDHALRRVAQAYPRLPVSVSVTAGDPASVLIQEARRAELAVVGHQQRTGAAGGAAAAVATRTECPVIIIPAHAHAGYDQRTPAEPVLVAVTGDDRDAIAVAFGLAEAALHRVPLRAVHVWLNIPDMELASVDPFVYDLAEARRDADRLIQAALQGWEHKYPQVTVQRVPLYRIDVADTLITASAQAGILVVGPPNVSHRAGRLGPVTRALIYNARCPVAVAR